MDDDAIVYKCDECCDPCELKIACGETPTNCPFENEEPTWKRVE